MSYGRLASLRARRAALLSEQSYRQSRCATQADLRRLAALPRQIGRLENRIADLAYDLDTAEQAQRDIGGWL